MLKLDYKEWTDADKVPAKVQFVKNEIGLCEKRFNHILEIRRKREIKEMTILTVISTVILVNECFIWFRLAPFLRWLNRLLLDVRKDNQ